MTNMTGLSSHRARLMRSSDRPGHLGVSTKVGLGTGLLGSLQAEEDKLATPKPTPARRLCHQPRLQPHHPFLGDIPSPSHKDPSTARSQSYSSFIPIHPPQPPASDLGKHRGTGDGKRLGNLLCSPASRLDLQNRSERPAGSGRPAASRCNE